MMRAHPALQKLPSVITTSCFPGMGCFNANWQVSLPLCKNGACVLGERQYCNDSILVH